MKTEVTYSTEETNLVISIDIPEVIELTIPQAIEVLEASQELSEIMPFLLTTRQGLSAGGDLIEAIATHIVMTDTPFILMHN